MSLRADIHRIFSQIAQGETVSDSDLTGLNNLLRTESMSSKIVPADQDFAWAWGSAANALERVVWLIIWSAAELFVSDKLKRVGQCAGESCGWLFLDTSRNGNRRWCEIKHCGNRAKARRHYRRRKGGG